MLNILEDEIGIKFKDIAVEGDFLNRTPIAHDIATRISKGDGTR